MNKPDLIAALHEEYARWQALLDQIGSPRMEQPGVNGDWSMKEMVAHLTGWNRWLVSRMEAAQHGQAQPAPPWPAQLQSEDEINAWIYESNRKRPLDDVLRESEQVFRELFKVVESLPTTIQVEKIEPRYYLVWLDGKHFEVGEFFDHYHDDHEPDVRAWLVRIDQRAVDQ
jgi:hypothetical protein